MDGKQGNLPIFMFMQAEYSGDFRAFLNGLANDCVATSNSVGHWMTRLPVPVTVYGCQLD